MMDIKKIYVAAPSTKANGGGETLHQFVDICVRNGIDAYIFYYDKKGKQRTPILEMQKYKIQVADEIEDKTENLLIFPEVRTEILHKYNRIRKCIWFLSLEFYLRSNPVYRGKLYLEKKKLPNFLLPISTIGAVLCTSASFRHFKFNEKEKVYYFLYNCEYARQYIEEKCNYKHYIQYLCGPLNDIYFDNMEIKVKEKAIAYSPKKSNGYVEKIINEIQKKDPSMQIYCIKNMSQEEVKRTFSKVAVYLDFGYFPGPERLPREAVISDCNLIVGKIGSAKNAVDIPIDNKYKFSMTEENVSEIRDLAIDMVYNYSNYVQAFDTYRKKVKQQKMNFEKDVIKFIEKIKND